MLESSGLYLLFFMVPLFLRGRTVSSLLKHKLEKPSQTAWAWMGGRPLPLKEPGARELAVVLKNASCSPALPRESVLGKGAPLTPPLSSHSPLLSILPGPAAAPWSSPDACRACSPHSPSIGGLAGWSSWGSSPAHTASRAGRGQTAGAPVFLTPQYHENNQVLSLFQPHAALGVTVRPEPILQCRTLRRRWLRTHRQGVAV